VLGVKPAKAKRVVFNAITQQAVQKAFANPRPIDEDKVNAQQARRILDRIVGYQASPLLWKKVARGLSAGRVQSVAVRLIVEREREIAAFVPDERWEVARAPQPGRGRRPGAGQRVASSWPSSTRSRRARPSRSRASGSPSTRRSPRSSSSSAGSAGRSGRVDRAA
jgi:DNA topoisomerase IA